MTIGVMRVNFFIIDLADPFLNFRVGVGQQGFRFESVECIGSNPSLPVLRLIAGIPLLRTSDKRSLTQIGGPLVSKRKANNMST